MVLGEKLTASGLNVVRKTVFRGKMDHFISQFQMHVFEIQSFEKLYYFILFLAALGPHCLLRLSLVAVSRGHSSLQCAGFSFGWPLLLRSTGSKHLGFSSSRHAGSVVVTHGHSCLVACGIFLDQGLNLCPLHWQLDSYPLCHH